MKMKRKLALLTSVVMLLGSLNVSAFAASGDVDGDGSITATDAELVMQYVLNPASITDATLLAGIEAEGDVATDCDDVDYTASNGTVITDHKITAKDAAFILQQSLIESKYVYIKAGKDGGVTTFKPISYEGKTTEEAQAAAQAEIADLTIGEYFDKYIEKFDSVSDTRISQVNDFLNKVYINDWALASDDGRAWIEAYLNVNSTIENFFDTAYTFVINGEFDISTVNDANTLFTALQDVVLTDADLTAIKSRINGEVAFAEGDLIPANYAVGDTIPELWLRTTFQVGIYNYNPDGSKVSTVDDTAMKTYEGTYSVAEWYYLNRAGEEGTDEQYFRDNFLYVVENYAFPVVQAVHNDDKVQAIADIAGGDRIELTINQGTLPSVAKNAGNYSTLEDFEAALGDFDDPTNTYYLDFSELGLF